MPIFGTTPDLGTSGMHHVGSGLRIGLYLDYDRCLQKEIRKACVFQALSASFAEYNPHGTKNPKAKMHCTMF